jgi:hypothetical protein
VINQYSWLRLKLYLLEQDLSSARHLTKLNSFSKSIRLTIKFLILNSPSRLTGEMLMDMTSQERSEIKVVVDPATLLPSLKLPRQG